jgi:hypothetical protein
MLLGKNPATSFKPLDLQIYLEMEATALFLTLEEMNIE